jgi:hypothetical protein
MMRGMLTRRAFLTTATGGAAVLAAARSMSGAEYDLRRTGPTRGAPSMWWISRT